ncbi:hypothetical protein HMPREF9626_1816 [Streptococcus parasanguinis F0405]|uniref:Uncharacterized protein n=1 Tax=Streptococcus parasanguinis F0405 TaxID=905067 RepID=E3CF54_STRPA|nr:hypothetical protein HMPREF9626_1816 [Streptococcus parasanguinis F0405]
MMISLSLVDGEIFSSHSPKIGQMSCFSISKLIILGFY